jgi:hypothetical protein
MMFLNKKKSCINKDLGKIGFGLGTKIPNISRTDVRTGDGRTRSWDYVGKMDRYANQMMV